MHPEYLSSKWAVQLDVPTIAVQHHHAHVAACMVEHGRTRARAGNRLRRPRVWRGRLAVGWRDAGRRLRLVASRRPSSSRPHAGRSGRDPRAMADGLRCGPRLRRPKRMRRGEPVTTASTTQQSRAVIDLARRPASPVTTSAGRLFDAVAALLGGRQRVSYEAQAAIELEAMARTVDRRDAPRYEGCTISSGDGTSACSIPRGWSARCWPTSMRASTVALIAAGFHEAFGRATVDLAREIADDEASTRSPSPAACSRTPASPRSSSPACAVTGFDVLVHAVIPPNDGGISVGQAAIAAFSCVDVVATLHASKQASGWKMHSLTMAADRDSTDVSSGASTGPLAEAPAVRAPEFVRR